MSILTDLLIALVCVCCWGRCQWLFLNISGLSNKRSRNKNRRRMRNQKMEMPPHWKPCLKKRSSLVLFWFSVRFCLFPSRGTRYQVEWARMGHIWGGLLYLKLQLRKSLLRRWLKLETFFLIMYFFNF